MAIEPAHRIQPLIAGLLAGPVDPGRIFGCPDVTYGDLYSRAAGLRRALDSLQTAVGPETPPVCLGTSDRTTTAAALLATLAGGPSLVMPHAHTEAVLVEMQRRARFDLAIADAACPLPPGIRRIDPVNLPAAGKALSTYPFRTPESPWVHLFTGGSTGTPQLWTKTAANLLGEAAYLRAAFEFDADDRILTTSPPCHIYGLLYALLVPLLAHAEVMTAAPAFPAELAAAIKNNHPTVLVTVPAFYRALQRHLPDKSRLRMAFSSASPLEASDADAFWRTTGVPLYDVYGSTETGGIACRCRESGEDGFTPFDCVDLQIDGDRLQVRSPFLAPELARDARGYYAAADRVAALPGGKFSVTGRADGVVKVGGKRVDLAAIRARLLALAGVRDALVLARPTGTGRGNEILALAETDRSGSDLSRALAAALPGHARPRVVKVVAKMPVTPAGKYDREVIKRLL